MENTLGQHRWFRKLWVEGGYSGEVLRITSSRSGPVSRWRWSSGPTLLRASKYSPRRWVVERTFGWLMQCRRPTRDYERTVRSATGWIHIAVMRIMLHRLA